PTLAGQGCEMMRPCANRPPVQKGIRTSVRISLRRVALTRHNRRIAGLKVSGKTNKESTGMQFTETPMTDAAPSGLPEGSAADQSPRFNTLVISDLHLGEDL